jgi:CDP-Glycerol:Poly(glycerophosphate) glycerophosphotransferase
MNGDVLFFDFAFEEYLPVIEKAAERGVRPIMNQPPMREALASRGTPSASFLEFTKDGDAEYAARSGKALGERFAAGIRKPGAANAFDSLQGNLLVSGGRDLVESILSMAQNQLLIARIMRRLIETTDLRGIVMRSCMSAGQRVIEATARQHGIPMIELAHGNLLWASDPAVRNTPWHSTVFGSRQKEIFLGSGSDPELVHVTGAPQWDVLYGNELRQSKEEARAELGIPQDQSLIIYASIFASGATLAFTEISLGLMEANEIFAEAVSLLVPAPLVAVRPHPGESMQKPGRRPTAAELSDYRRWFLDRGVNLLHVDYSRGTLVREKALLIRAADVVVTSQSSLVSEVLILDRPCVILDARTTPIEPFYQPSDGVLSARNPGELSEILDRILTDPGYSDSLREQARTALPELNHLNDGQASDRVADLIVEIGQTTRRTL